MFPGLGAKTASGVLLFAAFACSASSLSSRAGGATSGAPPPTPGPWEKHGDSPLRTVLAPSPASRAVGLGGGRDRQARAARPLCTATLSAPRTPSEALFLVLTRRAQKRTARRGASSRGHRRACPPTLPPRVTPTPRAAPRSGLVPPTATLSAARLARRPAGQARGDGGRAPRRCVSRPRSPQATGSRTSRHRRGGRKDRAVVRADRRACGARRRGARTKRVSTC